MKNFIQDGNTISLVAPYDTLSGAGVIVGSIFGVATSDVLSSATGQYVTKGVFDLAKLSTDVVAVGDKLYWDNTNKRLTKTSATGLFLVGVATAVAGNGVTTVNCRLDGISVTAVPAP